MRIGELARLTGVSRRSLRYYEQQGLLASDRGHDGRGHRSYDGEAVATVAHIRALLSAGIPTALIYDLLPCVQEVGPVLQQCAAPVLQEQLDKLDQQLDGLTTARARLAGVLAAAVHGSPS